MNSYQVRVEKEGLTFCAAHFITYGGGECERLHGHNYRVGARVAGPLNEHGYVVDFVRLRDAVEEVIRPLDHRLLLPRHNPRIEIDESGDAVEVAVAGRRYRFPRADVVLLPVDNTTAENLAAWVADRLEPLVREAASDPSALESLEVEVEETPGQSGVCARPLRADR